MFNLYLHTNLNEQHEKTINNPSHYLTSVIHHLCNLLSTMRNNEYSVGLLKAELSQWKMILAPKPRDLEIMESLRHSIRTLMIADITNYEGNQEITEICTQ